MLRDPFSRLLVLVVLAGCAGGQVGDVCAGPDDCDDALQCLNRRCAARCVRAPDCGDGYACDSRGLCLAATGIAGDRCASEVDCGPGLSCQIDGAELDSDKHLRRSCTPQNPTRPAGAECIDGNDCRNGTCALGHCLDLCKGELDCASGMTCVDVPSEFANAALYSACLPAHGPIAWSIPVNQPLAEVQVPVPSMALSAEVVMRVDDTAQKVGATRVLAMGKTIYSLPCSPLITSEPPCDATRSLDTYFANQLRHAPGLAESVLAIPSGVAATPIGPGMYRVTLSRGSPR